MGAKTLPTALYPFVRWVAGYDRGWWLLKRYQPTGLARIMGVPKDWDASDDPDFLAIRASLFPINQKRSGLVFGALVSEPASDSFPLEQIKVPTLLVHAADDGLAPYGHAGRAAARIPNARLVTIGGGGHLFLQHQREVRAATTTFVNEVLADSQQGVGAITVHKARGVVMSGRGCR